MQNKIWSIYIVNKKCIVVVATILVIAFSLCCLISNKDEALGSINEERELVFPKGVPAEVNFSGTREDSPFIKDIANSGYISAFLSGSGRCDGNLTFIYADTSSDPDQDSDNCYSVSYDTDEYEFDHWTYTGIYKGPFYSSPYATEPIYKDEHSTNRLRNGSKGQTSLFTDWIFACFANKLSLDLIGKTASCEQDDQYLYLYQAEPRDTSSSIHMSLYSLPTLYSIKISQDGNKYTFSAENKYSSYPFSEYIPHKSIQYNINCTDPSSNPVFKLINDDPDNPLEMDVPVKDEWTPCTYTHPKLYANFNPDLSSIEVVNQPEKTDYFLGEDFDKTGLKVIAHYGATSEYDTDITDFIDIDEITFDKSWLGEGKEIPISYTENGITKNASINVNVYKKLDHIQISQKPDKTLYYVGENFEPTGMIVKAYYEEPPEPFEFLKNFIFGEEDKSVVITDYSISPNEPFSSVGEAEITVTYIEHGITSTDSTTVEVSEIPPVLPTQDEPLTQQEAALAQTYDHIIWFSIIGLITIAGILTLISKYRKRTKF